MRKINKYTAIRTNWVSLGLLPILICLSIITIVKIAFAAPLSVGNDTSARSTIDTRADFTIVDTNHPASSNGTLDTFQYYASNANPFRFVVVDELNAIQWVSEQITPINIAGVNTFTPTTPVAVQTGWNVGLYFASTGTIPFDFTGATATYTAGGSGIPSVGNTLIPDGTSNRTYSFVATGQTATVSGPISEPVTPSPSPSESATPSASPSVTPSPEPSLTPSPTPSVSPSPIPSASPTPSPLFGDSASGAGIARENGKLTFTSFNALEGFSSVLPTGSYAQSNILGKAFTANLSCVNIVGDTAWFEGPIASTNSPSLSGKWVFGKAVDNTSFIFGDQLSAKVVSPDPSCSLSNAMDNPSGSFNLLLGNVVVNSNL